LRICKEAGIKKIFSAILNLQSAIFNAVDMIFRSHVMKMMPKLKFPAAAAVFAVLVFFGGNFSELPAQPDSRAGMSRSMEQAIRLYHEGQDNEAMDRFMDILVKGSPSEKSMANEYISRITLRMNTGIQTFRDQGTEGGVMKDVEGVRRVPVRSQAAAGEDLVPSEEEAAVREAPETRQARVAEKISERIVAMRRTLLLELGKSDAVKIYMGEVLPRAVTINPQRFFVNETVFKPNASAALSSLAGLIFTLGKANVLILPEGAVEGDVKIKNIRQAIALNSYLISRGISQARLDVNLTGADIRFPKELTNISGLILLFNYDVVPRLKDLDDAQARGPKVSLGVYPTAISVQKNEGALVEFSVFESPAGKPTWKFEIFSVQPDNTLLSLQKLDGYGPQYNQSYWNGRKNFFGVPYSSGKYMVSVTATDMEGRETNLRRFLVIKAGKEEEPEREAKKSPAAAVAAKAAGGRQLPPKKVKPALKKAGTTGVRAAKTVKGRKKAAEKLSAAAVLKEAPPASAEENASQPEKGGQAEDGAQESRTEFSGQVSYKIYFREETAIVTPNSEKKLAQVAETMNYYPMAKIRLIGYAYSGEANSEAMAQNRVNYVVARFTKKYMIGKDRMDISTQISDTPKSIVEIKMLGKE